MVVDSPLEMIKPSQWIVRKAALTCKVWEFGPSPRDSANWQRCLRASDCGFSPACEQTWVPSNWPVPRWRSWWAATRGRGRRCETSTAPTGMACTPPPRHVSPPISAASFKSLSISDARGRFTTTHSFSSRVLIWFSSLDLRFLSTRGRQPR